MSEVITSGTWQPNPGSEDAFVAAWMEFATWASDMAGAGTLRLAQDLAEPHRFISYGNWETLEAVRGWKGSSEFREQMASVLQHVSDYRPAEYDSVATAHAGVASREAVPLS